MPSRVVVLGSLNTDLVVTVPQLPRPGETVLGERLGRYPGGKGANQAVAAARLGAEVTMVGRVGADSFGSDLIKNLESNGVDASGVDIDGTASTGAALIYVDVGGQNMIVVAPGANGNLDRTDADRAARRLRVDDLLVMQLEIPMEVLQQAVPAARRAGARVLLNAAPARHLDPALMRDLDVLVVNEREASTLSGEEPSPEAAAAALRARGPRLAIITLGPSGSLYCDEAGAHRVEPFRVQAIDSTGAGDAFAGALAVALARRLSPEASVRFANAAGAAATTSLGAQAALPRLDDLERLFGLDLSFSEP